MTEKEKCVGFVVEKNGKYYSESFLVEGMFIWRNNFSRPMIWENGQMCEDFIKIKKFKNARVLKVVVKT